MTKTRGPAIDKDQRIERAAELLEQPLKNRADVVVDLAEEYEVSVQQAREYVREAEKLLAPKFDLEEIRYKHENIDTQLSLIVNEALGTGNLNAAVGAAKARANHFKAVREIDPGAAWDRQMSQAFCEESYPPNPNKKIPRKRIGKDLDLLDDNYTDPVTGLEIDSKTGNFICHPPNLDTPDKIPF